MHTKIKVVLFYCLLITAVQASFAQDRKIQVARDTAKQMQIVKPGKQLSARPAVTLYHQVKTGLHTIMDKYTEQPNTEPTWSAIRREVNDFLYPFFRDGRLKGTNPQEAYYSSIGMQSMTAADIAVNRKILIVGYAAVKPAEFDTVRIERTTALH